MAILPKIFFCLISDKDKGRHNFETDQLAILLTNIQPDQNWETIDQVPEITAGNGYPKGGIVLQDQIYSCKNGISKVTCRDVGIKAEVKAIAPFRWVVLFNKTNGRLISFMDHGSEEQIVPNQNFLIQWGSVGVLSGC